MTAIPLTPTNLLPIVSQSVWSVKMNNFTHIETIIVYAHTVAITTQKFTLQSTELTDNLFFTDLICDVGNIFPRLWQSFRRKQNTITLPNMRYIRCSLFQLSHQAGFPFFLCVHDIWPIARCLYCDNSCIPRICVNYFIDNSKSGCANIVMTNDTGDMLYKNNRYSNNVTLYHYFSINILAFYHEWRPLIGYATHALFWDR